MTETMPPQYWNGIEQFNQQQFYDCHDTLEALWMEAEEFEKAFYQGILQIAVALYHLSNANWRGAVVLLGEGSNRLQRYTPTYGGIDVAELLVESQDLLIALQQQGPEQVAIIHQQLQDGPLQFPRIQTICEQPGPP